MLFDARTVWIPKDLGAEADYEDAFAVDAEKGIAAVADGVSSALFSGRWAQLLTQAAVQGSPPIHEGDAWARWLSSLRHQWKSEIDTAKLPWFLKPKLPLGAFATLLWIEPDRELVDIAPGAFAYKSYATGDGCLFHVRGAEVLDWFPMRKSEDFAADPMTIGSRDRGRDHLVQFIELRGVAQPGDVLLLCTDALACWLVKQLEIGSTIDWWMVLERDEGAWRDWIITLRHEQAMRVDDTTAIVLRITAPAPAIEDPPRESSHDDEELLIF